MNPARRERIEDLGVIYEKLNNLVDALESDYPYFQSKHSYETFQEVMLENDCDKLEDFHRRMRWVIEELNEIVNIAHGSCGDIE